MIGPCNDATNAEADAEIGIIGRIYKDRYLLKPMEWNTTGSITQKCQVEDLPNDQVDPEEVDLECADGLPISILKGEEGNNAAARRQDQWNDGKSQDRIIEDFQGVNEENRPDLFTE